MSPKAATAAGICWGVLSVLLIALQVSRPIKLSTRVGSVILFALTVGPLLLWLMRRAFSTVEGLLLARARGAVLPWLAEYVAEKSWAGIAWSTFVLALSAFFIPVFVSSCLRVRDEDPVLVAVVVAEVLVFVGVLLFFAYGKRRVSEAIRRAVALRQAAAAGKEETVRALLREGADANAADRFGWTPMYWAASRGQSRVMHVLDAAGGAVDGTARRLLEDFRTAERERKLKEARELAELEERQRQKELAAKMAAESVGVCAVCGRYVHRDEPYYQRRESGMEPVSFPAPGIVHYDVPIAVYHKACAERAGLV